jgi:hypothetical protein
VILYPPVSLQVRKTGQQNLKSPYKLVTFSYLIRKFDIHVLPILPFSTSSKLYFIFTLVREVLETASLTLLAMKDKSFSNAQNNLLLLTATLPGISHTSPLKKQQHLPHSPNIFALNLKLGPKILKNSLIAITYLAMI